MKYSRFFAMIITSTIVMLGLMYLNSYSSIEHAFWSETRFDRAIVMGASMAVIMLSFMLSMYKDKSKNILIYLGSILVFFSALFLVRSQITIDDTSYMSAMIPHHSIAIMTSDRSNIKDIRVRELANGIIKAQRKEIKEMDWLINDINENGIVSSTTELNVRQIPNFEGKVDGNAL